MMSLSIFLSSEDEIDKSLLGIYEKLCQIAAMENDSD
jgi:hypothetical protein